jgi:hypothetical protein
VNGEVLISVTTAAKKDNMIQPARPNLRSVEHATAIRNIKRKRIERQLRSE